MASLNTITQNSDSALDTPSEPEISSPPETSVSKRKRSGKTPTTIAVKFGKTAKTEGQASTKAEAVLKKLRSAKGVTMEMLVDATGWQAHSVRGFLSGTVKKKLGLLLTSEVGKDGVRRYRIDDKAKAA